MAQRVARRERDDLLELLFGVGELAALQLLEPDGARRDQRAGIDRLLRTPGEKHNGNRKRNESFHAILAAPCHDFRCSWL